VPLLELLVIIKDEFELYVKRLFLFLLVSSQLFSCKSFKRQVMNLDFSSNEETLCIKQ
jgi:hypothetical protein